MILLYHILEINQIYSFDVVFIYLLIYFLGLSFKHTDVICKRKDCFSFSQRQPNIPPPFKIANKATCFNFTDSEF